VAVTRGTLERLNRDELQGVVGHEFSHVLNGDMRLNIRLIGVIFGILAIGIVGRIMARLGSEVRGSRDKSAGIIFAIVLVGLLTMLVGYIGTLIGRIIQAAVSRQREYLADSSSVQFTRNPSGLSGALKKIGGLTEGSRLKTAKAEQASHMFFGQGVKISLFSGLLATHPPLVERIQRIDPQFTGKFQPVAAMAPDEDAAAEPPRQDLGQGLGRTLQIKAAGVAAAVGNPTPAHVEYGAALRASLPVEAHEALAAPGKAAQLIYALLLDPDPAEREKQVRLLQTAGAEDAAGAQQMFETTQGLDPRARLPLVDLATPTLRDLPYKDLSRFLNQVEALVAADSKVTLFEFCLHRLLNDRLVAAKPDNIAYRALDPLLKDLVALLAAVAQYGNPSDASAASAAFRAGCERVAPLALAKPPFSVEDKLPFGKIGAALTRLSLADYPIREQVVDACAHCVLADETVTVDEAELLRVICSGLACPLPPFLPN
jgi:hypothetical protein